MRVKQSVVESGCGKSTVGKTLLRLYDLTDGKATFDGKDLGAITGKELRNVRVIFK